VAKRDLTEYRRKRDPARTSEPMPTTGRSRAQRGKPRPVFVVQRHDARRLHYDFRLERDGALASWAVPKGVPLEPGEQHLAVHVEDHPLSYATFEGEIPAGNYGAGTVEIWDHGTYELVEEKPNGGLTVLLHGERLNGLWTLVPAKLGGNPKNWLIVKKKEEGATERKPRTYRPMLATLQTATTLESFSGPRTWTWSSRAHRQAASTPSTPCRERFAGCAPLSRVSAAWCSRRCTPARRS